MSVSVSLCLSSLLIFLITFSALPNPSISAIDTFIFGGCAQIRYFQGSPYESNVNSILTSLVNSASAPGIAALYNKYTVPGPTSQDTVYGLYQCRGDLNPGDCARCVARCVSQLGALCLDSCGGALQLEGCFVKYDNATFLGVEDKTVVVKKCGPSIGYDSDALTRRDAVLGYLEGGTQTFRVGGSGNIQGMAQCVGDLSASECQDCVSDAIGRLRSECGTSAWGDMFLAKCYARFWEGGDRSHTANDDYGHDHQDHDNDNDEDIEKTLAILIGLIAGVALIIVFLSFLRKVLEGKDGK